MSSIIKVNTYQDANGNALFSSDGSGNLTGTNKLGITMADMWRLNANNSITGGVNTVMTSNWEQIDTNNFSNIGSSMTQSSGDFTFPETGVYLVNWCSQVNGPSQGATYAGGKIYTTTDNSTYTVSSEAYNNIYHPNGWTRGLCSHVFNVTNTTTHKVRFIGICEFNANVMGNTSLTLSYAQFIRLGA